MTSTSYFVGAIAFCFVCSTLTAIGEDNCSKYLNQTTCCAAIGCSFYNCTNQTSTANTTVCIATGDEAAINKICKPNTSKAVCNGPAPVKKCEDFTNQTECCNETLTGMPECDWVNCKNKTSPSTTHQGCHNSTDKTVVEDACVENTAKYVCKVEPEPAVTCRNFTDQETCCHNGTALGCVFVNCTGDGAQNAIFEGCYNKTEVTCKPLVDQCQQKTTTVAPPPTTTPIFKKCEHYSNDAKQCCGNPMFKCIYVNCTTGPSTPLTGCFSMMNESQLKEKCSATYFDACAATTPRPTSSGPTSTTPVTTTAAPSHSEGRHFDGASFIGGIVLCAGIVLIIFFALKWYRSRQSANNYHQM